MSKHRAVIIGCGRMGAGRDHVSPWVYTHIEAYLATDPDRVEVVGFVDRVLARAQWAADKWRVPFAGDNVAGALEELKPDIVSICTPPSDRYEILKACDGSPSIRGIWCEKPYTMEWVPDRRDGDGPAEIKVQVNYIRRFDQRHQKIRERRHVYYNLPVFDGHLLVISANDIHTTSHFTDLAEFWQIPREKLRYIPFHGPSLYILREPGPDAGRYAGWKDEAFVGGGVETGFMEAALNNLLDAVDGTAALISPAQGVFRSERWAESIVSGTPDGIRNLR
jgi:hypothetical protein